MDPKEGRKAVLLASGLAALLAGAGLLLYGLAPAEAMLDLFGDFKNVQPDSIQNMMDELGARVWLDALGAALLVAGIVVAKVALKPPKPKSIEEQVNEAVEARLAAMPKPTPVDVPPPAPKAPPLPPAGPRCPKCGRLKIAGGKLCRQCDMA
ncbi:MAG: hypothetical protein QOD77_16 [Thermoplasmata archaeon]|jgi:hypothetical protein|nr:hypothetical protein [Thermoplasmata archaeon]